MSKTKTLSKFTKRRHIQVTLPNDESIEIQPLTIGQMVRRESIAETVAKIGFTLGCALLDEDGSQLIPPNADEADGDYGIRGLNETGLDMQSVNAIRLALETHDREISKPAEQPSPVADAQSAA